MVQPISPEMQAVIDKYGPKPTPAAPSASTVDPDMQAVMDKYLPKPAQAQLSAAIPTPPETPVPVDVRDIAGSMRRRFEQAKIQQIKREAGKTQEQIVALRKERLPFHGAAAGIPDVLMRALGYFNIAYPAGPNAVGVGAAPPGAIAALRGAPPAAVAPASAAAKPGLVAKTSQQLILEARQRAAMGQRAAAMRFTQPATGATVNPAITPLRQPVDVAARQVQIAKSIASPAYPGFERPVLQAPSPIQVAERTATGALTPAAPEMKAIPRILSGDSLPPTSAGLETGTKIKMPPPTHGGQSYYRVLDQDGQFIEVGTAKPGATDFSQFSLSGKAAVIDRIDKAHFAGQLDPTAAVAGRYFLEQLPSELLRTLAIRIHPNIESAKLVSAKALAGTEAGFYSHNDAIVNIVNSLTSKSIAPERVVVHEVAHHLEQFVPASMLNKAKAQFALELKTIGRPLLDYRAGAGPVAPAGSRLAQSYRYTEFPEWFAEVISDKALRDFAMAKPAYRPLIQRTLDTIREFGVAVFNVLKKNGQPDAAEQVYRYLIGQEGVTASVAQGRGVAALEGVPKAAGPTLTNPVATRLSAQLEASKPPISAMPGAAPVGAAPVAEVETADSGAWAIGRLAEAISEAKPLVRATKFTQAEERARRAAIYAKVLAEHPGDPEAALTEAQASLAGKLPKVGFVPIGSIFTAAERSALFERIKSLPELLPFERVRARLALNKVLDTGIVPQRNEIILLERVFGEDVASALLKRTGLGTRAARLAGELITLPKTLTTMGDFSAVLRQGGLLVVGEAPRAAKAFRSMLSQVFSERGFQAAQQSILTSPHYAKAAEAGLYISRPGVSQALSTREEAYMSRFLATTKLPGLKQLGAVNRASERAYIGFLNQLRANTFYNYMDMWEKAGKPGTIEEMTTLANFLNEATGRGKLGSLEPAAVALNNLFFSPRYFASRIEAPLHAIHLNQRVGRIAAKNLVASLTAAVSALALLKYTTGATIELDRRSADFGKAKIGNTRLDFFGGYQQIARFVTTLVLAQRKQPNGKLTAANRLDIVEQFGWTKAAPFPLLMHDLLKGKTIVGEDVYGTTTGKGVSARHVFSPPAVGNEVLRLVEPMAVADIIDAVQEQGAVGAAIAAPTAFGVGVTTYQAKTPKGPTPWYMR